MQWTDQNSIAEAKFEEDTEEIYEIQQSEELTIEDEREEVVEEQFAVQYFKPRRIKQPTPNAVAIKETPKPKS